MAELSLEQQRALAAARARQRAAAAQSTQPEVPLAGAAEPQNDPISNPPQPAAPVAEEPSLTDYIMGTTTQAGAGIREGLAALAGLPVDLVNISPMALNLLPGEQGFGPMSESPAFGSNMINEGIQGISRTGADVINAIFGTELTGETPEPVGRTQRVARRVGQEFGAMALPVGGSLMAGARMGVHGARRGVLPAVEAPAATAARKGAGWGERTAHGMVEGAKNLPANMQKGYTDTVNTIVRGMTEPAAVNPSKFARQEITTATGAGLGGAAGQEVARWSDTDENVADLIGAILGAGATGAAGIAWNNLRSLAGAATNNPKYVDDVIRDEVAMTIADNARVPRTADDIPDTESLANTIMNNRAAGTDVVPGLSPSTADASRDPGLRALEYGRSSGPNQGMYAARRESNIEAADQALSQYEPDGAPGALRSQLEDRRTQDLMQAERETGVAREAFDIATQNLSSVMSAEARGADIRNALEGASDKAKQLLAAAWEPLNRDKTPVDAAPLRALFADMDAALSKAETRRLRPSEASIPDELVQPGTPDAPSGLLDQYGQPIVRPGLPESGLQPLNEITGLRSALTDAQREAANGKRLNEARVVGDYIKRLDEFMDANLSPGLKAQYDEARAATREYNDRFTRPQTAIGSTLQKRDGMYAMPDSAVPGRFVQSDEGNLTDFNALMREAGSDKAVRAAVRDQMLADINRRGLMDRPDALDRYLGRYGTVLDEFPELRTELTEASEARRGLTAAEGKERELTKYLTEKGPVGQYLRYGNENAEKAMRAVINDRNPGEAIDELLNYANNNRQSVEGARQILWDMMRKQTTSSGATTRTTSGTQPWNPERLRSFLDDPRSNAVLDRLYRDDPEHLDSIRKIADAIQSTDTRTGGRAANTSGTAQSQQSNMPTAETIGSRVLAVRRGQIGPTFLALNLASIWARKATKRMQMDAFSKALDEALLNPEFAALILKENNPANRAALRRVTQSWKGNQAATLVDILEEDNRDESDETRDAIMGD